ncbi:MAG: SRPBCC family protein [Bryobacteraceae bacterium]|nr:SRPBCC family protein [Bryobacteraceae bacterium]
MRFTYASEFAVPVEALFAFHERPDAFELLTPPRAGVRLLRRSGGLEAGAEVELEVPLGPLRQRWLAVHTGYEKNRWFVDEQREGPFARWVHRHEFEPIGPARSRLTDSIDLALPGGPLVNLAGALPVRLQLLRMFRYRHAVTRKYLNPQK